MAGLAAFGNADAPAEELGEEGRLYCFVRKSPASEAPSTVRRRGADGADVELVLENVECTLLADSVDAENEDRPSRSGLRRPRTACPGLGACPAP